MRPQAPQSSLASVQPGSLLPAPSETKPVTGPAQPSVPVPLHPPPRGDLGEAHTGGAALSALHVSPVKALGPCGDQSTGAATLSLGRRQGRALAVWPRLGVELGGVLGGGAQTGRPTGSCPSHVLS